MSASFSGERAAGQGGGGLRPGLLARLRSVQALLVDLEGTVRFGGVPIAGAAEALNRLRAGGYRLRFTTNIDSMRSEDICRGLTEIGAQAYREEIFTPVAALQRFVEQHPGKRWFLLVSEAVAAQLGPVAEEVPPPAPLEGPPGLRESPLAVPDFVVVGDFRDRFSYQRLNAAYRHLMNGAGFLALQPQPFFMGPDGYYLDTGAIVHMLEWASGKTATILGKPSADYYRLALADMGLQPQQALVIGDDVGTDVTGAVAAGCASILVRTGKYRPEKLEASPAQPDLVLDSLAAVPEVLESCHM